MSESSLRIAFFGGEPLAVPTLEILKQNGIIPTVIVCNKDTPQGRKMIVTAPPVKLWAEQNGIPVFQPGSLDDQQTRAFFDSEPWDLFIVVAFGKIMPSWLLKTPLHKTINVHPSLLPLLRGPSPIRSALLQDMRTTGVSIMLMDEQPDHGPVLAQEEVVIEADAWPMKGLELDALLAATGAELLSTTVPKWIEGSLQPIAQDDTKATFTEKIKKTDGELSIDPFSLPSGDRAYQMYLKICAYDGNPGTFFFYNGKRIKIADAALQDNTLVIKKVIPEGGNLITFEEFISNLKNKKK